MCVKTDTDLFNACLSYKVSNWSGNGFGLYIGLGWGNPIPLTILIASAYANPQILNMTKYKVLGPAGLTTAGNAYLFKSIQ